MIPPMRRARRAAFFVGCLVVLAFAIAGVAAAAARPAQVTTTGAPTTVAPTTAAPTTAAPTTTEAPTTAAPATTEAPTTSSSPTTTVAPASTSSGDSSTPWGWIIFILALVAIALIAGLVVLARNRNRAKKEWKDAAASSLRDADLVRDMLAGEARPGETEEATRVAAVRDNVERVSAKFDQLASTAPNDEMRDNSTSVASSLRGYFFALEAEQLLHGAPTSPTADQLAAADATKRARNADLQTAVERIRAYVSPARK
jgi:hypothetical protein